MLFSVNTQLPKVSSFDLLDMALIHPRISTTMPDTLKIVSGYATHAMAVSHFVAMEELSKQKKTPLPLHIDLIYGMAGSDGVGKINHQGFVSLEQKKEFNFNGDFRCSYVKKPRSVHSKIYVWCKNDTPVKAFIGSANYSENGFKVSSRTETLAECDPFSALDFIESVRPDTIHCLAANIERDFPLRNRPTPLDGKKQTGKITIETDPNSPYFNMEKLNLSLLTRFGDTGNGSNLNWGVKEGGIPRTSGKCVRDPNQSYIGVPIEIHRSNFFPEVKHNFTVMTDDGKILTCVRAQANGKGLETTYDNAELGRYFRQRLGLPSGAFVTVSDLKKYGRFDVTFYKQDDENYIMDFSSTKNNKS